MLWNNHNYYLIVKASSKLIDLIASFEIREPKNANLYYETAKLFARLVSIDKSRAKKF
jgi:hypothetical protein